MRPEYKDIIVKGMPLIVSELIVDRNFLDVFVKEDIFDRSSADNIMHDSTSGGCPYRFISILFASSDKAFDVLQNALAATGQIYIKEELQRIQTDPENYCVPGEEILDIEEHESVQRAFSRCLNKWLGSSSSFDLVVGHRFLSYFIRTMCMDIANAIELLEEPHQCERNKIFASLVDNIYWMRPSVFFFALEQTNQERVIKKMTTRWETFRKETNETLCKAIGRDYTEALYAVNMGCDVNFAVSGCFPLELAIREGKKHTVKLVKLLLENNADVNLIGTKFINDGTALHAAVSTGDEGHEVIQMLIDHGSNVEARDNLGYTPLMLAVSKGNMNALQVLIEKKANIYPKDRDGNTALLIACQYGSVDVVEILLRNDSKVNDANNMGFTPLMVAARGSQRSACVVKVLMEAGADVHLKQIHGATALHNAAQCDTADAAKILLDNGSHVNDADYQGFIPLMIAVQNRSTDTLNVLIDYGANIHHKSQDGGTALHCAAKHDSSEAARVLLDKGSDVNDTDNQGFTPLMVAVQNRSTDTLKILITNGAKIHHNLQDGGTALHCAVKHDSSEAVRVLLDNYINETDNQGFTPLMIAAKMGYERTLTSLIEKGADIHCKRHNNGTALHCAAMYDKTASMSSPHFWPLSFDNAPVVQILLDKGSDVNDTTNHGFTPLMFAAQNGNTRLVQVLIKKGANLHLKNLDGWTALTVAVWYGQTGAVRVLLAEGSDVDGTSKNGYTPLMFAAQNGNTGLVQVLIEEKASLDLENHDGWTALTLAVWYGQTEVVRKLLTGSSGVNHTNKKGCTPLMVAIEKGDTGIFNILIEQGAAIDFKTQDGWTALHCAAKYGELEMARIILDTGSDVNVTAKDGTTPLMCAAHSVKPEIIRILIENDANVGLEDTWGSTALHKVASCQGSVAHENKTEVLNMLIDNGSEVNCTDKNGYTPLIIAAWKGHNELLLELIAKQANVAIKGRDGYTALHQAAYYGHAGVAWLLLANGSEANDTDEVGTPQMLAVDNRHIDVLKVLGGPRPSMRSIPFNPCANPGLFWRWLKGVLDQISPP